MGQKTRTNDSLLNTKSRPTTKRKEHHGHMLRSPLAPAAHHSLASSLISCIMTSNLGEVPSKTQPFLCFHIHQDTSTTKELKPLRDWLGTRCTAWSHQSAKILSFQPGASCCSPISSKTENHTLLANTQGVSKCWTFSSSWSHKGQRSGCSSPHRANRSAVQQRLRIANHTKKFASRRSPGLPNFLPRIKSNRPNKEAAIGWFGWVFSWGGRHPNVLILNSRTELNFYKKIPKLKIFYQGCSRQTPFYISNPCIIDKGILHYSSFNVSFSHKWVQRWSKISQGFTMEPFITTKQGSLAISYHREDWYWEHALREKHRFVTGTDGPSVTGLATVTIIGLQMTV